MRISRLYSLIIAFFIALQTQPIRAQELEPRSYVNTPIGMNFAGIGYAYSKGGVVTDPSIPLTDADIRVDVTVLGYAHALDFFGRPAKVDLIVPYAWLDGTAKVNDMPVARKVSGLADPRVRFSYIFYGAPALSLEEFKNYHQDLLLGASLQVGVPVGQYDNDRLVNIGTNRWLVKPELGVSKAWGPVTVELATAVNLYGDNDEFFPDKTREQDPIYSFQGHLIYNFGRSIWAGLDATYFTGGRTRVDGVEGDDLQKNSRVGATLALPVNMYNSIKLYASTGVSTRTGSNFDTIGVAWQVRWGGGLGENEASTNPADSQPEATPDAQ